MPTIDDDLAALEAEVTTLTSNKQATVERLASITAQLKSMQARVGAAVAAIDAAKTDLATAVAANTPATPAP